MFLNGNILPHTLSFLFRVFRGSTNFYHGKHGTKTNDNIDSVHLIELSAEELSAKLLGISETEHVCILDSCGVGHLGSHLMIAGILPVETLEISGDDANRTLELFEEKLSRNLAAIFTISYDFGLKLQKIKPRSKEFAAPSEPDIFIALFDALVIYDYNTGKTKLTGNPDCFDEIAEKLEKAKPLWVNPNGSKNIHTVSNFTRSEYLTTVETVKEYIRSGDTYQANITQRLSVDLPSDITPQIIFSRLRKNHPAPFAGFIKRKNSTVVSASPERFIRIENSTENGKSRITASPVKGTSGRGQTSVEDAALRRELLDSAKDRAENTMIVDLMRNDLGRVCEYGSITVEKLCDLEEHPTLFHLVSTVSGEVRRNVGLADIIRAVFPCGSITGAPKIRTMQIIDEIETAPRGLSMGAIGFHVPDSRFQVPDSCAKTRNSKRETLTSILDLNVAIRTMVIHENKAVFNVGGGIVIDSDPEKEYDESMLKAKALLEAIGS
jgi:para-aminobenzoate synthetase component 1